jgi:hypothetical protein
LHVLHAEQLQGIADSLETSHVLKQVVELEMIFRKRINRDFDEFFTCMSHRSEEIMDKQTHSAAREALITQPMVYANLSTIQRLFGSIQSQLNTNMTIDRLWIGKKGQSVRYLRNDIIVISHTDTHNLPLAFQFFEGPLE